MRDTAARRSTAVAVCLGVLSVGLSAALLALTLFPGEAARAGRGESVALAQSARSGSEPSPTATPDPTASPSTTPAPDPEPAVSLPTSDRTTDVADFPESTITCFGDVYWDWQVGNRARGGSGSCHDWAVAMELDKDGPTLEQQELLGLLPEQGDTRSSGEIQWDHMVEQGVIDDAGNYLDEDGDPTGETTYDDEGCDPETTDCD